MYKWDDLRVFLATYRTKSATQAARELKMTQATVSRRLNTLEEALGHALFVRTPEGMLATEFAETLIPMAEEAERASLGLMHAAQEFEEEPRGLVRLAVPEDTCALLVVPRLLEFVEAFPKIQLELLTGTETADMTRLEADLAMRLVRPTRGNLRVQQLNQFAFHIYGSPTYLSTRDPHDLVSLDWIDWSASLSHIPDARWLRDNLPEVVPRVRSNSMRARREAVMNGLGVAILPDGFELGWPEQLRRLPNPFTPLPSGVTWLVGHAQTRYTPRIRVVWDFIVAGAKMLQLQRAQSAPNTTDTEVLKPS